MYMHCLSEGFSGYNCKHKAAYGNVPCNRDIFRAAHTSVKSDIEIVTIRSQLARLTVVSYGIG